MIRPKQLAVQDEKASKSRLGWVEPKEQITCYQCYKVNLHILPECAIQVADVQRVVENCEKLLYEQKKCTQ